MAALQPMWLRKEEVPTLPDGWRAMQTSEVTVQLKPGKLFEKRTVTETGLVPVLSQGESGFIGYHDETPGVAASPNIPVVTFANHTCAMRLMKRPFSCIQNIFPKIGREDVCDTLYFYYAALGRVTISDYKGHHPLFRQTYIPVPPLSTQWKIAVILSAYDDLIENNLRRIKILEEMAQNLYREWFVKFRFPGHQHARFTDSPLERIPEGWGVASISDVAIICRGRSYKGTELAQEGGRPFVNLKCIERDGGFRSSGLKRYTGPFKDTHTVRAGEMVMAITDMTQERRIVARVGRVSRLDADFGVISMDLVRVASRGSLSEIYLYAMLRWSGFADEVKQHANGVNVLHLLPDRIEEYRFVCPTSGIAAGFGEVALPMLSLCDSLEQRNATLHRTRDLLLPRLISGEVDVSELEIAVPEEAEA